MSYIRIEEDFGEISESLGDFKARLDVLARSLGATDDTAFVKIYAPSDDWGSSTLDACVWREETKQEQLKRLLADEVYQASIRASVEISERKTLKRLKAKYG